MQNKPHQLFLYTPWDISSNGLFNVLLARIHKGLRQSWIGNAYILMLVILIKTWSSHCTSQYVECRLNLWGEKRGRRGWIFLLAQHQDTWFYSPRSWLKTTINWIRCCITGLKKNPHPYWPFSDYLAPDFLLEKAIVCDLANLIITRLSAQPATTITER